MARESARASSVRSAPSEVHHAGTGTRLSCRCTRAPADWCAHLDAHDPLGEPALEQLVSSEEEDVDPHHVIVGHLGDRRDISMLLPIAERGAFLGIDNIGYHDYQTEERRAQNVIELIDAGFRSQVLLSMDIATLNDLQSYGARDSTICSSNSYPCCESSARRTRTFRRCSLTTRNEPSPSPNHNDRNNQRLITRAADVPWNTPEGRLSGGCRSTARLAFVRSSMALARPHGSAAPSWTTKFWRRWRRRESVRQNRRTTGGGRAGHRRDHRR